MASKKQNEEDQPDTSSKEDPGTSSSTPGRTPEDPENKMYPEKAKEETVEEAGLLKEKMAPKKQKRDESQQDIKEFLKTKNAVPGSSSSTPRRTPEDPQSEVDHRHQFKVKFHSDSQKHTVYCKQPRTVLKAIQSHLDPQFKEKIKKPDENLIIKIGEGNDSCIIPTHFPCSLVEEEECLTVTSSPKVVEKQRSPKKKRPIVLPKENYSVFFIDKEGGKNSISKTDMIFRCNKIQDKFRYYCVYGRKGMTVMEALQHDGRFVDDLTDFTLSDNNTGDFTSCTEIVDNLHGKKFQICLPRKGKGKATAAKQPAIQDPRLTQQSSQEENASASVCPQNESKTTTHTVLELAGEEGVSIKTAMEQTGRDVNLKEIEEMLRQQYPKLKAWMESRFPGCSLTKALKLEKENFGKIQNSFSEVRTVRRLLELSEVICLLKIQENNSDKIMMGTGFLLFDELVLTNAHLFEPWKKIKFENWQEYLSITAKFNFEHPFSKTRTFPAKVLLGNTELDFALLELVFESKVVSPPGLLKRFGPVPQRGEDGGACIIGHPAGGVKKMDITSVIRKEDREQAVERYLEDYKDYLFTVCSVNYQIKSNPYADIHVTYNSFMYHGSSGSPVFDASGRVFGLHSGGFFFDNPKPGHSVIEYAYPLLTVFKILLGELQKKELLERVIVEAQGNPYLDEIIDSVGLKLESKDKSKCSLL